jgi:hypothetical protein
MPLWNMALLGELLTFWSSMIFHSLCFRKVSGNYTHPRIHFNHIAD